jgi:uncharacterized protein (DUF488 family)
LGVLRVRIVYTLGHSNRSLRELLEIIGWLEAEVVADIRRWPGSRRYPWFSREALSRALECMGVEYLWLGRWLGGYRRLGRDVADTGGARCFESPGFRAYALYVTTNPEAWDALMGLERVAVERRLLILCMERLPWRCHRKIVSDILTLHGFRVIHIIDPGRQVDHKPAPCARLLPDGRVAYT